MMPRDLREDSPVGFDDPTTPLLDEPPGATLLLRIFEVDVQSADD